MGRLEQFRALATGHAEPAACYRLTLLLATTIFWKAHDPRNTPRSAPGLVWAGVGATPFSH